MAKISQYLKQGGSGGSGAAPEGKKKKNKISQFLTQGREPQQTQRQQEQQQRSQAAPPSARQQNAPSRTYAPIVDASRVKAGSGGLGGVTIPEPLVKGIGDAVKNLPGIGQLARSFDTKKQEGETVEIGDILPGLQEALKPVFRSAKSQAEYEQKHGVQSATGPKWQEFDKRWRELMAQGMTGQNLQEALGMHVEAAGLAGQSAGDWLRGNLGNVGGAVAGVPKAAMNLLSLPGALAEQAIGVAEQKSGIAVDPMETLTQAPIAQLATAGAALARSVGLEGVAQELDKRSNAPASVVSNLIGNLVARQRMNGEDSSVAEQWLERSVGFGNWGGWLETPSAEDIIKRQTEMIQASQNDVTGATWDAAQFAYEGTEFQIEAQQRIAAGEDRDAVMDDIDSRFGAEERINDFAGQMLLDPLNALDAIGGLPKALGLGSRSERAAAEATRELLMKTDDGVGLLRLAETGGDIRNVGSTAQRLRDLPGVGFLFRPLPETLAARRSEEAASVIKMITQGISPNAPARLLEEGITIHPTALAIESFVNHAADDIAGTGKSASQIQEMLGLGARAASPDEIARLGAAPGTMIDMYRSNAADRARDWFEVAGGDRVKNLADEFVDMQRFYSDTMRDGFAKIINEAGEETVVKGWDAVDLAENRLVSWLENMNDSFKAATGFEDLVGVPKKIQDLRKSFGKAQGFFRFFHMGTNPGFAFRNWASNVMTGWIDDFNLITPLRNTQSEIGRLGLSGGGLGRQLGAQSDVVKALREGGEGIKGFLRKHSPLNLSGRFESEAGQRVYLQSFQRQMADTWRVGKAIPEDEWAGVARLLGDRADEAKALIEGARTQEDLNKVIARITDDEPWRASAATALAGTHDEALRADLDDLLRTATDPADAVTKIEDYVAASRDQFNQLLERGRVIEGSPAAKVLEAVQAATNGIPPKRQSRMLDDFSKQLIRQDATEALTRSYANQALEELRKVDPTLWGQLEHKMRVISESRDTVMKQYRPIQYQYFEAVTNGDWGKIRELGEGMARNAADNFNPFQNVVDKSSAWDTYFQWTDEFWSEFYKAQVPEMQKVHQAAADAVQAAGKPRPPDIPADMIENFMPLTRPEQRRLFAQLDRIARSRGLDTVALRDVLKQEGIIHANNIFRADIIDMEWYNEAVKAVMRHSRDDIAKGAAKTVDDSDTIAMMMHRLEQDAPSGQAVDLVSGSAAQMAERDSQIQHVVDNLRQPPTGDLMDEAAINRFKEFLQQIEPRMTAARGVAEHVATSARDFALLNYGDENGLDLVAGLFYNYPKWYMGTMSNMLSRVAESPGKVAALIKFRQQLRKINRDLPEWWQDQVNIKTPWGPMYANVLASFDPFNGFLGDKFRDPDLYNDPLSSIVAESTQYGPGLHGVWSTAMAIRAALQGDREASMGWVGSLGPATKGVTALTALAREHVPGMDNVIPAGGVVLEPWLWSLEQDNPAQMIGTKYDSSRIGLAMAEMVRSEQITPEEAYDAMLSQRGEIFDEALQQSKLMTWKQTLGSWLFGAGVKPRPEIEIEVQRMDMDRRALMQARADGYYEGRPEAWRQAWEDMREDYPWMDFVQGFRRDRVGRANIYAMSVYDRLPPNPRPYFKAMGLDEDVYSDLLDKFYGQEEGQPLSIENLEPASQELFMSMMKLMGATMALPGDATAGEWNMARQARAAMYDQLNRQYTGIQDIQSNYFDILNSEDENAAALARQYLDAHGQLQAYWDDKDRIISQDPLLAKYWGSMELFERASMDEFEARMDVELPGIHDALDEYYRLKDIDPAAASDFLAENDIIKDYWNEKDLWMISLDEELRGMTDGISNLEGQWGELREGVDPEMLGQQRVVDLIQSGARPMGDFELPEDMQAEQLQASIQHELNQYQGNWGNLYRQLKAMGNLDDTLSAFQEWGRGKANVATIMANQAEAKALLVALASINDGAVAGGGGGGYSGGSGGGRRSRRLSSSRHGGASSIPKGQEQAAQQRTDEEIGQFLSQLQERASRYWGMIRNLADMTPAEIAQFLDDPANAAFRQYLSTLGGVYGLQSLIGYWNRQKAARAKVTPRSSSKKSSKAKIISVRQSQPGL